MRVEKKYKYEWLSTHIHKKWTKYIKHNNFIQSHWVSNRKETQARNPRFFCSPQRQKKIIFFSDGIVCDEIYLCWGEKKKLYISHEITKLIHILLYYSYLNFLMYLFCDLFCSALKKILYIFWKTIFKSWFLIEIHIQGANRILV